MKRAIDLAINNVDNGGGPFGCVIVKNGKIVGEGVNNVTKNNDPTAHAEIVALRNACRNLNNFQLNGCEIYTSCEPCPMCLGAIYWARASKLYKASIDVPNVKAEVIFISIFFFNLSMKFLKPDERDSFNS
jgi:guanine deaminase